MRAQAVGTAASSEVLIGGRYRVLRPLGGGGMGHVYEVCDNTSARRVALKRPDDRSNPAQAPKMRDLFAREFHTLAQVDHPHIVAVYDYGVDEVGPFYTMELLDGGDLQALIPASPMRVCAIARDVCSALSFLHARRVVHRDVSPRNIRCTSSGTAKLIDFGAMTLMGPNKELVGTPAYCAPEIINLQPLDARTDLFALGATLYYALTGRHAYPARDFASLPNAWHFGFARPSDLAEGVPAALDALVLDLLHLDPQTRPSNAAEVMERLAAIEGRPVDEHLLAAQSFLTMPALVGRDAVVSAVRKRLRTTAAKRGSALLIEGPPGVGRSRLLDASVLAGKLQGLTVLRADADDAEQGDYGAMRALVSQLQRQLPDATRAASQTDLAVLVHAAPELGYGQTIEPAPIADPGQLRLELQRALQSLWLRVAAAGPILVAIDDIHRLDEASTAALALLAGSLEDAPIAIIATYDTETTLPASSAFRLFSQSAAREVLPNLDRADTATLLRSVFGVSAPLDMLTHRLFAISHGNPRDVMRLAQHLVNRKVVRYRAGSWSIPSQLEAADLPSSVAQMLAARVHALSPTAHRLACAFALCPEHSFSFEECVSLALAADPAQVIRDVGFLVKYDLLRTAADRFVLTDRAWVGVILPPLPAAEARDVHLRLARTLERRSGEEFRTAQHVLRAGEHERALDLFIHHAQTSLEVTDASPEAFSKLVASLPRDALQSYKLALRLCEEQGRPKRQVFTLRSRIAGIAAIVDSREAVEISAQLLADLREQSGLADWDASDPTLEPMLRLTEALQRAQARYDAASEHERVLDPATAIRSLARSEIESIAGSVSMLDLATLSALPSLEPLAALSPALSIIETLNRAVQARFRGHYERARLAYRALLERIAAPDRGGLTEAHHRYMQLIVTNGIAMIEASMGLRTSLTMADVLEADPMFRVNAVLIRMLYHLWQGNVEEAERCERRVTVIRIQSSGRSTFENAHLVWQVMAHAAVEDLTRLKRTVDEVQIAAADHAGWQPVLAYGRAEYLRVCGDLPRAIAAFEALLAEVDAGQHQSWASAAGAHVRALDDAGATELAVEAGDRYLARAERVELGSGAHPITLAWGVAAAKMQRETAAVRVDAVLDALRAQGTTGLALGLALEARARIALALRDSESFERYGAECEATYNAALNPALSAKSRKLLREATRDDPTF